MAGNGGAGHVEYNNALTDFLDETIGLSLIGATNYKLPPKSVQEISQKNIYGCKTLYLASIIFEKFVGLIGDHRNDLGANPRILDFGCGWGRITRFFPYLTSFDKITGMDVDEEMIGWAQRLMPHISFVAIEEGQSLPVEDGAFDLVISNSVFSHLSSQAHIFCINELARVTRPGGLIVVTTINELDLEKFYVNYKPSTKKNILKKFGSKKKALRTLAEVGFLYDTDNKRWKNYGMAFCTDNWLLVNWGRHFRLLNQKNKRREGGQQVNIAIRKE